MRSAGLGGVAWHRIGLHGVVWRSVVRYGMALGLEWNGVEGNGVEARCGGVTSLSGSLAPQVWGWDAMAHALFLLPETSLKQDE